MNSFKFYYTWTVAWFISCYEESGNNNSYFHPLWRHNMHARIFLFVLFCLKHLYIITLSIRQGTIITKKVLITFVTRIFLSWCLVSLCGYSRKYLSQISSCKQRLLKRKNKKRHLCRCLWCFAVNIGDFQLFRWDATTREFWKLVVMKG